MQSKTYYSVELARLTVGYDLVSKKTTVRQWSLAANGPDLSASGLDVAIVKEVSDILHSSAEQATYESFVAAYAVPGEITAKLATAWEVFWQRFPLLVESQANEAAKKFIDLFSIGLTEIAILREGLVIEAAAGQVTSMIYEKLYSAIQDQIGGDVGKAVGQYFGLLKQFNELTRVNISFQAPKELTDVLAEVVNAEKMINDIPQRLADLAAQVGSLGKTFDEQISSVVLQLGSVTKSVAKQLQAAGIPMNFDGNVINQLSEGIPRLFIFPPDLEPDIQGIVDNLQSNFSSAADAILSNATNLFKNEVDVQLAKLLGLQNSINNAVKAGARDLVNLLSGEFRTATLEFDEARERLSNLENNLRENNFVLAATKISNISSQLIPRFNEIKSVIDSAPIRVAEKIAEEAKKRAEQALIDFQNGLDAIGNAAKSVFGIG